MNRPTVALLADPGALSVRLVESLISSFSFVKVLSDKQDLWTKALSLISQKNHFQIVPLAKQKQFTNFEYLVLVNLNLSFSSDEILKTARQAAAQSARILVVLPYVTEGTKAWQTREKLRGVLLRKIPEAGIVYAGEVFGPRYWEENGNFIARNLASAVRTKSVEELQNAVLFPISVDSFCRYLTRNLFSFGPYGRELAVYSEELSSEKLFHLVSQAVGELSAKSTRFSEERQEVLGVKVVFAKSNVELDIRNTLEWLKKNVITQKTEGKRNHNPHFVKKGVVSGLAILAVAPFFLGLFAIFGMLLSFWGIKGGKVGFARQSLSASTFLAENSQKFFSVYRQIPIAGYIYAPFISPSTTLALAVEIGADGLSLLEKTKEFGDLVLGDAVYDPTPIAEEIAFKLDLLYQKTSFLTGEVKNLQGVTGRTVSKLITEENLEYIREKILGSRDLVLSLPKILGKGTPTTYLILFQNNMELRPTGGFIGSFALASFDSGRLIDINVSDVYSADGQLKGHVEPPAPIRKYLGEANWFLRDSNWDPDFPTAADRAQWFLDKEIDRQVDGVIAIDLEVAKGILEATGPVVLADFNQVFDYTNLYEKLQAEVEGNFFPGSQKKTNILTALSRELTNRLSSLEAGLHIPVAKKLIQNLEEKHIQIFFNDPTSQKAVLKVGYGGVVAEPSCLGSCFTDWYGAVDANVGVTKANYFIERQYKTDVVVSQGGAKKTIEITYINTANPALGQSARYRTYTRLFAPTSSIFSKIKIENAGVIVETDPELEAGENALSGGVNIEVSPGQTKKLIFSWTTPLPEDLTSGEYFFHVKKQAGTGPDPLEVNILTDQEVRSYNTVLARDLVLRNTF